MFYKATVSRQSKLGVFALLWLCFEANNTLFTSVERTVILKDEEGYLLDASGEQ
jgi:hypothetical protein